MQETFTVAPWETDPEQFLRDLEEAVREYAPHDGRPYVLMPVFREIDLIARNRERFEPTIKVAAPAIAKHRHGQRRRTGSRDMAESYGLAIPRHVAAQDAGRPQDARAAA